MDQPFFVSCSIPRLRSMALHTPTSHVQQPLLLSSHQYGSARGQHPCLLPGCEPTCICTLRRLRPQASFEPLGLTIAVAKDRAIESLMQVGGELLAGFSECCMMTVRCSAQPAAKPALSSKLMPQQQASAAALRSVAMCVRQ